jgi:hypothetical protein
VREKTLKHTPISAYFKLFQSVRMKYLEGNKKAPPMRGFEIKKLNLI